MTAQPVGVVIWRGGLYMAAAVCERYFADADAVALVRRGGDLAVLPVRHAAGGGYLLKRRNKGGDRVVTAPEFFRSCGFVDDVGVALEAHWDDRTTALIASDL